MREALQDFFWAFLVILSYAALRQLHALGQGVLETVVDSVGIAAIFSFLMYVTKIERAS
jgi:hypothetical protein